MKKKLILIITSILALILLTVSIVLVVTFRRTSDGPAPDDSPDVNVGEATVLVETKNDVKTRFSVDEDMPDLTEYFNIYEDLNPIEVKFEYITSELDMAKSGIYKVTCSYKEFTAFVTIYVEDIYEMTAIVELVEVTVGQTDVNYKQYFQLKKNGQSMEITDDMMFVSVDISKESVGIVNCVYLNQSKSIRVIVKLTEEAPVIPSPGPENPPTKPVDDVRLVVSSDLTFPVGAVVSLTDLCELYDGETKVENPSFKFVTDLNIYMAGVYSVKTSLLYKYKEYTFDDFVITITALEDVILKEKDIEKLKTTIIDDEQDVYKKYFTPADLTIKYDFNVGNLTIDFYSPTDLGIMFYYDSEKDNDIITLSYLLQYYYSNASLINLPKFYVLDINMELNKLNTLEQTESNIKLKSILLKLKNEDYTSLIEVKNPGLTAENGDLWVQGNFYYKSYKDNEISINALQKANNTYDFKTYSNYLDFYFNKK